MALGAEPKRVQRETLGHAVALLVPGAVAGIALAVLVSGLVSSQRARFPPGSLHVRRGRDPPLSSGGRGGVAPGPAGGPHRSPGDPPGRVVRPSRRIRTRGGNGSLGGTGPVSRVPVNRGGVAACRMETPSVKNVGMDSQDALLGELKQRRPFRSARQRAVVGLMRVADILHQRFAEVCGPRGVTPQQYNVLRILRGARPERLPTMEIADRMIERTPGITRLLDRLDRKGLVDRERCAEDRRQVLCSITPEGLDLLAELDDPVTEADEAALATLDDEEIARLNDLLDRVLDGRS